MELSRTPDEAPTMSKLRQAWWRVLARLADWREEAKLQAIVQQIEKSIPRKDHQLGLLRSFKVFGSATGDGGPDTGVLGHTEDHPCELLHGGPLHLHSVSMI